MTDLVNLLYSLPLSLQILITERYQILNRPIHITGHLLECKMNREIPLFKSRLFIEDLQRVRFNKSFIKITRYWNWIIYNYEPVNGHYLQIRTYDEESDEIKFIDFLSIGHILGY